MVALRSTLINGCLGCFVCLVVIALFLIPQQQQQQQQRPHTAETSVAAVIERPPADERPPPGRREAAISALAVFAVGAPHASTIEHTIERFLDVDPLDVHITVWLYLYDEHEWGGALARWRAEPRVHIVDDAPKHLMKLQFAKEHLQPSRVQAFDYLFLWDGDGVLDAHWSPARYLHIMKGARLDISQPSLADQSQHSFPFNYEPFLQANYGSSSSWTPALYAEIGFIVYRTAVWRRIWTHVLQPHDFVYWCFDALPYQCLRYVNATVGIVRMPVLHPDGRHLLGIQVSAPSPAVKKQLEYEISTAQKIVACSHCCQFIDKMTNPTNNNGCFPQGVWTCPDCQEQVDAKHASRFYSRRVPHHE